MEFSPHPSSSNTQSLGQITFPLSPSFIHGMLALTSYCSSEWHAMLSGIQFIWGMYNHKPYPLQPGRPTQWGPGEREKEAGWGSALRGRQKSKSKTCLLPRPPPVVPVKCGERWYFVFTWMSTNSKCMCWLLVFRPLRRERFKECQRADREALHGTKDKWCPDHDNGFSRSCCLSCGQVTIEGR